MGVVYTAIEDHLYSTVELKLPGGENDRAYDCPPGDGPVHTANRRESKVEYWLKRMRLPL